MYTLRSFKYISPKPNRQKTHETCYRYNVYTLIFKTRGNVNSLDMDIGILYILGFPIIRKYLKYPSYIRLLNSLLQEQRNNTTRKIIQYN